MKLKKIELFGFKSFPEPTEIILHDGITSIVGPNGCGKSNVIDALRWVMGETSAKGLRGGAMEDVIFSGSETRSPLNLAEVTLTLTEVEGSLPEKYGSLDEVAITRRLHRSGESEYRINKIPCRLRDITELFMDTGVGRRAYSVMEQGRIAAILDAKPTERRFLIEEAAGITKYRSRKDETVRKMDHVRQNLQRLADVIGEVRREMNALKRQAGRAAAFKRLRGERKELERHRLVSEFISLKQRMDVARRTLDDLTRRLSAADTMTEASGARVEAGRVALLELEKTLEARQRVVYDLRNQITQREGRAEFLEREVRSLVDRAERLESEADELADRRSALVEEQTRVEADRAEVEARIAGRTDRMATLVEAHRRAEEGLRRAEGELDEAKRALMGVLGELTRTGHTVEHLERQEAEAARRLEGMGRTEAEVVERLEEVAGQLGARADDVARAQRGLETARVTRQELVGELEVLEARAAQRRPAVEAARRELHRNQSRLDGLEQIREGLEWYGAGVRAVLEDAKKSGRNGVRGVVADILTAPPEYEPALEAALGERLQYVIVEDPRRGVDAVEYLKGQRAGRSSFAPVALRTAGTPVLPPAGQPGGRGALLELVGVAEGYGDLARALLGDVYVVDTLDDAVSLWQRNGIRATLVTLGGETVSPEGVISGGASKRDDAGLLRKNREIRDLKTAVTRGEKCLKTLEAELSELDAEVRARTEATQAAREAVHRAEMAVVHVTRDHEQLSERRDRLVERRDAVTFEREGLAVGLERMTADRQTARLEREALLVRQGEVEDRVAAAQAALETCRSEAVEAHSALTRFKVEEAGDRQRREGLVERHRTIGESLENVASRLERIRQEARTSRTGRAERGEEGARLGRELDVLRTELGRAEGGLTEAAQALDAQRGGLGEQEKAAGEARRRCEQLRRDHSDAELVVRDLARAVEALVERFEERVGDELAAAAEEGLPEGYDPDAAGLRAAKLDEKIATFGEINLLAIEEYEQRKERYDFLEAQKADLEESLTSLQQAIGRINRVSRQRFGETFEKVSATFRTVYPKLFRGGEAQLLLTDPDDLLATGIDIVARPPGKRPQHINLLSGGEKALTAVALVFSVFLVKPSPFCLLDEVDAPLDDANIGRFTEVVRELAAGSQFLVITHNKSTMEMADHLYGVTMAEAGVSKVVSVRLTEAAPPARAA